MSKEVIGAVVYISTVMFIILLSGCMATSSYYTGRTLEPGKEVARLGADYVLNRVPDDSHVLVGVSKGMPAPSFGLAFGLPLRLETSIRWYPVRFLEGSLPWQVNPRSFDAFDASLNFSYAGLISEYSYARYGVTISKNINEIEPYINYSFYQSTGRINSDLNIFSSDDIKDFANSQNHTRSIAFGVAIPIVQTKLFPEIDCLYWQNDPSKWILSFGIGLQINGK